jgi:tetratricopeptide (TPR) repeat protein
MIRRLVLFASAVLIVSVGATEAQTGKTKTPADLERAREMLAAGTLAADSGRFVTAIDLYRKCLPLLRKAKAPDDEIFSAIAGIARVQESIKTNNLQITLAGKDSTVIEIVDFRIKKVVERHGPRCVVVVDGGAIDGLAKGYKGEILATYSKDMERKAGGSIGQAEIIAVEPNSAMVEIVLSDTVDLANLAYEGDMVSVPTEIPFKPVHSIVFDLSKLNIEFLTNKGLALFHFRQVLEDDGPVLESEILTIMARDVQATVPLIQKLTADNPSWTQPLTKGRFAGISMLEGMEKTTPDDVRLFLGFVKSFPGKYMGHTWRINETYATWMLNGTPLGESDLRNALLAAAEKGTLDKALHDFKGDLETSFIDNWGPIAIKEAKAGNPARAIALADVSIRVAETIGDTATIGWAHFNKADLYDEMDKYEECMAEYAVALPYFRAAHNARGEYSSVNNIAMALNSLDRYAEALERYDTAIAIKQKLFTAKPTQTLRLSLATSHWGRGNALFNLSRYPEALEAYQQSISMYDSVNSLESAKNKVRVRRLIARVHEKRGDYEEALKVNKAIRATRKNMGDYEGEADALDNVGYCLSQLGKKAEALEKYGEAYEIQMAHGLKKDAGFSRSNMGQMLWTLGKYEEAIKAHREAISLKEQAGDKAGQAYSWGKLASLYKETGDPKTALEAYTHVLALNREVGSKADLAQTYNDLGDLYHTLKDYKRAIEQFQQALAIRTDIHAQGDVASTLYSMSWAYTIDKDYPKAIEYCNRALQIQTELGDKSGQLYSLVTLGHISQQKSEAPKITEELYRKALDLAAATASKTDSAYCLRYIAYMEQNQGKTQAALDDMSKALELYEQSGERSKMPDILCDIGYYLEIRGDFVNAARYFDKALAMADSTKNRLSAAAALNSLGDLHRMLGEYAPAVDCQQRALKAAIEVDNVWMMASAHLGLGNAHNYAGEFKLAIREYEIADSLYTILGNEVNRGTPINNIGTIYYWAGDYDNALVYFKQALAIWTKGHLENSSVITAKENLGETYFRKKSYAEAHAWLEQALAIGLALKSRPQIAEIQGIIGKLYLAEAKYDSARVALDEAYRLAHEMGQKERIADAAAALGQLYHDTHVDSVAIRYLQESVTTSHAIGSTKYLWEPLYTLGLVYRDRDEKDRAITYLKDAVNVIEEIRGKVAGSENAQKIFSAGASKVQVYETLVSLLMKSGKVEEAFNYLERSNNQGLREQLGPMAAQMKDPTKNTALAEHRELKNKVDGIEEELIRQTSKPDKDQNAALIASLKQRKQIAESQYTKFVNETIKNQKELAEYFSDGVNPLELREAKRDIPKDVAVVAYLTGEQQLYIFVATSDSVGAEVIEIPRKDLKDRVTSLYDVLHRPSSAGAALATVRGVAPTPDDAKALEGVSLPRLSEDLYSILISPIESKIKGKKKLAIIANAELNYLPFQVLGQTQKDGKFRLVVDDWSVFYVMRMKVFSDTKTTKEKLRIAAFGNADSSLPNAEMEVKELKKLYADATVFVRTQATKERVLSLPNTYSAIHFATHGILDYGNIENSYLVLAPGDAGPGSGHLTIDEVTQMTNLYDTRLVTLSACNTAIGKEMIKGWLINPANAFLRSGVRTVVASLWQVDDAATSILMKEFYKNLKTMEAVDALRSAQMTLIRDPRFIQPYFWAGFVLLGQWK